MYSVKKYGKHKSVDSSNLKYSSRKALAGLKLKTIIEVNIFLMTFEDSERRNIQDVYLSITHDKHGFKAQVIGLNKSIVIGRFGIRHKSNAVIFYEYKKRIGEDMVLLLMQNLPFFSKTEGSICIGEENAVRVFVPEDIEKYKDIIIPCMRDEIYDYIGCEFSWANL